MAKVKNIGRQPRGFWDESFNHVVVGRGEEKEFNMSENDYKKLSEMLEAEGDFAPFQLSGGAGGATKQAPKQPPKDDHDDKSDKKK